MSRFKVYIKPFEDNGEYNSSFTDVTSDVDMNSLGSLSFSLDGTEFDVGTFTYSNFTLRLRNEKGLYSDVGNPETIFRYKRSNSIVRITWQIQNYLTECGLAECGNSLVNEEVTIAEGLLNDEATSTGLVSQAVSFTVLSYESIFDKVETPYSSITNGDTVDEICYAILNQTAITSLVTVSSGNINSYNNFEIDDKSTLENTTVKEALDELLFASNSVLYIEDNVLYVKARTVGATLAKTFYGQSSEAGIEDIQNLSDIKSGLSRTFNFWTWADKTNVSKDASSIAKYGVKKKEISTDLVTNTTKIDTSLASLLAEFKNPKRELKLSTPISYANWDLSILDKVTVDYPTPVFVPYGEEFPLYGVAVYGTDKYPFAEWSLTLTTTEYFKIIGYTIDLSNHIIKFTLREV